MAPQKREWFTKTKIHLSSMVRWTCTDPQMLSVTSELDGRNVSLHLTPEESRALGISLIQHSNMMEEWNRRENKGPYTDQQEWAVERSNVAGTADAPQVKGRS